MTASAEHVIEEIRRLPPDALREVWEAISHLAIQDTFPPKPASDVPPPSSIGLEEEDEAAFFKALAELRQIGKIRFDDGLSLGD